MIRENWNIIYWFIEIRWISFSEFCILSQLSSSPLNRNVQNILCTKLFLFKRVKDLNTIHIKLDLVKCIFLLPLSHNETK